MGSSALYSLPWCFFLFKTYTHHLVQKKKQQKNRLGINIVESEYLLKETKRSRPFFIYFPREDKLTFTFQFFLHEVLFNVYLVGNFLWSLVKIFAENVARGNSVQIGPNFPAKSLILYHILYVYITKLFRNILLINLTDY